MWGGFLKGLKINQVGGVKIKASWVYLHSGHAGKSGLKFKRIKTKAFDGWTGDYLTDCVIDCGLMEKYYTNTENRFFTEIIPFIYIPEMNDFMFC